MISGANEQELELANVIADKLLLQKENKELNKQIENYKKLGFKHLQDQNVELSKKYVNAVSDYETTMAEKEQLNSCQEEIRQLKKQFENCYCNRTDCSGRIKDSKVYDSLVQKVETQQKEFIKYLEDKIYSIEPKGTGIIYNCEYDSEEDYVRAMKEQSRLNTFKNILQKYKEIIGDKE